MFVIGGTTLQTERTNTSSPLLHGFRVEDAVRGHVAAEDISLNSLVSFKVYYFCVVKLCPKY